MTTTEKLLVQIFERKNWIIQQVKQQIDLYDQHLVSRCVIDGIAPPPWLWNSSPSSSHVQKELNKEELISKILLPRPQHGVGFSTVHCSLQNRPVVAGDNGELLNRLSKDSYAFAKGDAADTQVTVTGYHDNNAGCTLNSVPDLDVSVTSPQDETDVRISNIYTAPDQSLARIQRSRSRQRALELRNSAKAGAKSHINQNNAHVGSSARISFSVSGSKLVDQFNDPEELTELCLISHATCRAEKVNERDSGYTVHTSKPTRSINSVGQANSIVDFLKEHGSSENIGKNDSNSAKALVESRFSQIDAPVSSTARNRLSVSGSKLVDQVNDRKELSEPCVISPESWRVGELNERDSGNKEKEIPLHTGELTRSRNSVKQANSVVNFEYSSSDYIGKNDCSLEQYKQHSSQFPDYVNGTVEFNNTFDAAADSCGVCEAIAEDCRVQKEKSHCTYGGSISNLSSSQEPCSLHEAPEVDIAVQSTKADSGILAQSIGRSVQQPDDADDSEELRKPSEGPALKRKRLKTPLDNHELQTTSNNSSFGHHRDTRSNSCAAKKSLVITDEVHSTSDVESILPCADTHITSNRQGNSEAVNANDLMFDDIVTDRPVNSRSFLDKTGLGCVVAKHSSDCLLLVEPKQLDYDDSEKCNLNEGSSLALENSRLEKSRKEVFGTSSNLQVASDHLNNRILETLSLVEPEISTKFEEFHRSSFKSTTEEQLEVQIEEYGSVTNGHLKTAQYNPEVLHVANSHLTHQEDITKSNAFESSETENHMSLLSKDVCMSPSQLHIEVGQCRTSGKGKHTVSFYASARKQSERSYSLGENGLHTCGSVRSPLGDDDNLDLSKSRELQIAKKLQSLNSWPRSKKRKFEDHETDSFSASPSFRAQKHYCSQIEHTSINFKMEEADTETVLGYASPENDCVEEEMCCQLTEQVESSAKNEESVLYSIELKECVQTSSSPNLKQVEASIVSNSAKDAGGVSKGCLVDELEMADTGFDVRQDNEIHIDLKDEVNLVSTEGLTSAERTTVEGKSYLGVDGQLSHCLAESPHSRDLDSIGVNHSFPVFQGFIIHSQPKDKAVDIPENQIDFDKLELPRSSVERASILEQICRSASTQTPLAQFSSAFKLQGPHKLYQSVSNGVLEGLDLKKISALNEDIYRQIRSGSMDDLNGCLQEMPDSNPVPFSEARFDWTSRKPYASPVGKLWEKMSSHGSSSERLSSNPELTCFPIEEDPCSSEENENVSMVSDKVQEDIDSSIYISATREPLADITEACSNAPSSVFMADKFVSKVSANSVGTEVGVRQTHNKVKRKKGNYSRNKIEKGNDKLSIGADGIKKSEDSLNNWFSKVNSSCKTSSRTQRHKFSEKEPNHNNIVSNVTSFIPMVQQKQAAALCTGKRDVKVKALEAAEAAKRQEEKRENERKMRKEALKIERAKMEQENLRKMEMNKRKKEEERKKKDADIVAKKRLREQKERKEKEGKRKRMEEAQQQQREEGKLHFEKVEKEKQLFKIDGDSKRKEAKNVLKKSPDLAKESRDNITFGKPEAKPTISGLTSHVQQPIISLEACGTSSDSFNHREAMPALDRSPKTNNLIVTLTQEKSYEISPYQCSDDDEKEEEDRPSRKYIPSWSSKSCVALALSSQLGIEPDVIFPPESFCRPDEVFLLRKKQQKLAR